jgi:hypothetical protein
MVSPRQKLQHLVQAELDRRTKAIADDLDDLPEVVRLASRLEPAFRRQFLEAVAQVQDRIVLNELARSVLAGNLTAVEAAAHIEDFSNATPGFKTILAQGLAVGVREGIKDLNALGVTMNFALVNPAAVRAAETQAIKLAGFITDTQIEMIRDIVVRSTSGEFDVFEAAKRIKDYIGLDPRRTKALEKFEQTLRDQGLADEIITRRIGRYKKALLKDRSLTIARTEIINAASTGQQTLWSEALKQGSISKDDLLKEWLVTDDDLLDANICLPLMGVTAEIDEPFDTPVGPLMGPTAHPRCRCSMGLVERKKK